METIQELDKETFKQVYTNEELRNAVSYAHGVLESNGSEWKKALMYPISYKVNDEQIKICSDLINKRKKEVLKENKHNLLFCGMGCNFEPCFNDGVGNHRIRTEFINKDGIKCFIEVGTAYGKGKEDNLRIDHALIFYCNDKNISYNERDKKEKRLEIERSDLNLKYTYQNVLNLVNQYFNCNFKKMVLDYYNISCDGVLCISPK